MQKMARYNPEVCPHLVMSMKKTDTGYDTICLQCDTKIER